MLPLKTNELSWCHRHWFHQRTGSFCSVPHTSFHIEYRAKFGSISGLFFRLNPIRIILNNIRWSLMDNKFKGSSPHPIMLSKLPAYAPLHAAGIHNAINPMLNAGECALRDSGKSFTIVRPGHLLNEPAGQHQLITGKQSRS